MNLLSYALDASSETKFDGFCLTWFDQILACDRIWPLCVDYKNAPAANESYVDFLKKAEPNTIEYFIKKPIHKRELFELIGNALGEFINVSLELLSIGPTELDKISSDKI